MKSDKHTVVDKRKTGSGQKAKSKPKTPAKLKQGQQHYATFVRPVKPSDMTGTIEFLDYGVTFTKGVRTPVSPELAAHLMTVQNYVFEFEIE
jgi:hypothetical protein